MLFFLNTYTLYLYVFTTYNFFYSSMHMRYFQKKTKKKKSIFFFILFLLDAAFPYWRLSTYIELEREWESERVNERGSVEMCN